MAVPKKKTSYSRKQMRRAHDALGSITVATCKNCGETTKPHNICKSCGSYNGKNIINKKKAQVS